MNSIVRIIIGSLAVYFAAHITPGVHIDGFGTAIITAVVLALINAVIKPILVILTLPITILTLGLFMFVINASLVLLVSSWIPGFYVSGFWAAFLFSIIVSIGNSVIHSVFVHD